VGQKTLEKYKKIALDTNIFIYLIEKNEKYVKHVKKLFDMIEKGRMYAVTSTLLYTEVLAKPFEEENQKVVDLYRVFLSTFPNLIVQDVDKSISVMAAKLRAKYRIRTPDAIFLATGMVNKADAYITNDVRLKKIKEIEVLTIDEIVCGED